MYLSCTLHHCISEWKMRVPTLSSFSRASSPETSSTAFRLNLMRAGSASGGWTRWVRDLICHLFKQNNYKYRYYAPKLSLVCTCSTLYIHVLVSYVPVSYR